MDTLKGYFEFVIPGKPAVRPGIQCFKFKALLDSGFRRSDVKGIEQRFLKLIIPLVALSRRERALIELPLSLI